MDKLKERLEKYAKRKCWCDSEDFCIADYAGNYDDVYQGGFADGEASVAREILEYLKNEKI